MTKINEILTLDLQEDIKNVIDLEDRSELEIQQEIEQINNQMREDDREYILIGPGRWGSRDQYLGVPVIWSQINRARVIIEYSLPDFEIEPSQGSHFFHNLIAMNVGYLNVSGKDAAGFIDWPWIKNQKITYSGNHTDVIVLERPVKVMMDGKNGQAILYK